MRRVDRFEKGFGRPIVFGKHGEKSKGRGGAELSIMGGCWLWERLGQSGAELDSQPNRN